MIQWRESVTKIELEGQKVWFSICANPSFTIYVDLLRHKSSYAFDQTEINNSSHALDVGLSVNNEKESVESFNQRW